MAGLPESLFGRMACLTCRRIGGNGMDRRNFLVGSMSVTAAAVAKSLKADSQKKRKKKHRVAIIGCGRFGQYYAEVYRNMPDTELVAISEWK